MTNLPGKPKVMATINRERIRRSLLELGTATKAELSKHCGISSPTVGKVLELMSKKNEITTIGYDDSSGGRRAMRYSINSDSMLGITLCLEKNESIYSLFNCLGEELECANIHSEMLTSIDLLEVEISRLISKYPNIASISIGIPGAVKNGEIFFIPDYDQFSGVNLQRRLEERFGMSVIVENDMNAAVIGYHDVIKQSHAQSVQFDDKKKPDENISIAYIYLGKNGPGSGILINGEVLRGSTSFAGEIEFMPQYDNETFLQRIRRNGITKLDVDAMSRLIAAFVCIINPHYMVFCHRDIDNSSLEDIINNCSKYFPTEHMPEFHIRENWKEDYTLGLRRLGLRAMFSGIRIVKD